MKDSLGHRLVELAEEDGRGRFGVGGLLLREGLLKGAGVSLKLGPDRSVSQVVFASLAELFQSGSAVSHG